MYLYILAGIFLSITLLSSRASGIPSPRVPWYDWLLALSTVVVTGFFVVTAEASLDYGWEYAAPQHAVWASIALYALILGGILSVWLISAAMQGYVSFFGSFGDGVKGWLMRGLTLVAGILLAAPVDGIFGLNYVWLSLAGAFAGAVTLALAWRTGRAERAEPNGTPLSS